MEFDALKVEALLAWYDAHARDLPWRKDQDPYHVWLSEIMLQQTRVEAVKEYYLRFLDRLPTINDLANVSEEELLKLWEGLGYYNRARNLQKAAMEIVTRYGGKFPKDYDLLLKLPGVGEYTAGAVGSICFDLQTPAVDGNVLRVYTRALGDYSNIDLMSTKKKIREALIPIYQTGKCGRITQGFMELGATVCVPKGKPDCDHCPFGEWCKARERNAYQELPVREPKKNRRKEDKTVFLLLCEESIALEKRDTQGLLAGMWQFPNVEGTLSKQEAVNWASQQGLKPKDILWSFSYTHIFSHVEWNMQAYGISCGKQQSNYTWETIEGIHQNKAIPSAFRPVLDMAYTKYQRGNSQIKEEK